MVDGQLGNLCNILEIYIAYKILNSLIIDEIKLNNLGFSYGDKTEK